MLVYLLLSSRGLTTGPRSYFILFVIPVLVYLLLSSRGLTAGPRSIFPLSSHVLTLAPRFCFFQFLFTKIVIPATAGTNQNTFGTRFTRITWVPGSGPGMTKVLKFLQKKIVIPATAGTAPIKKAPNGAIYYSHTPYDFATGEFTIHALPDGTHAE